MSSLWIKNIGMLATPAPSTSAAGGEAQANLRIVENAAILCVDGKVACAGARDEVNRYIPKTGTAPDETLDANGAAVIPGFVDCHTHLVYAGNRVDEYDRRLRGASYLDILAKGGGILDTVRRTRSASEDELYQLAAQRAIEMAALGTTTVEVKTGYGLDLETEMKMLRVVDWLNRTTPLDYVPTFLGAHAVPPEFSGRADNYVDYLISEVLPAVAESGLAEFVDVFCETGVFSVKQSERLLRAAISLGLKPKMHADEMADTGASRLAASLSATSADHLIRISPEGIQRLAESPTIAVLLPATAVFIGSYKPAPARDLISHGVPVAIGTDHNPGTSPVLSMPLCISLACSYLRMTPAEALTAATQNAAFAAGRGNVAGVIAPGYEADIVVLKADDYREIPYYMGSNLISCTIKAGTVIRDKSLTHRPESL